MKPVIMLFLMAAIAATVYGQDSLKTEKPLISGYADVYYKYNLNENITDNKTSFTHSQNSFELGMISLKVQHSLGKVSFMGQLGFGKRAEEFSYNDKNTSLAIEQLYMSYAPADRIKFSVGSFATHIGYELVDANLNRNYSMSYMFSYGPFFHTGIKVDFTVGTHTFMAGIFNPTDYKYAPLNSKKYIGAQWGFSPRESGFNSYLNFIGGKGNDGVRNDQVDLVITYKITDDFTINYDGTYSFYKMPDDSKAGWWGSALYLNADFTDAFGITLRTEYFDDKDRLKVFTDPVISPFGGNILSFTLSGNYKIKTLTLIPEFRLDHASSQLFTKNNSRKRNSSSVLVAVVYSF